MPRYKKTQSDLIRELSEQVAALRASSKGYEEGHLWEAKRLATTSYILVHDSIQGRSKSLLTQLGLRASLRIKSSISDPSEFDTKRMSWDIRRGLIVIRSSSGSVSFAPKLEPREEVYRSLSFGEWYEEVIFKGLYSTSVSRKNLIHYLRSQDGGAHVDSHLDNQSYVQWKMLGDPAVRFERDSDGVKIYGPMLDLRTGETVVLPQEEEIGEPIPNSVPAAMRQVAWELDQALAELGY